MKRVEVIIRPIRLESVKAALSELGVSGMTVTDVRGSGSSGGQRPGLFRGEEYIIHLPAKIKLEMTVRDSDVDEIIETILEHAYTGEEGDGKIFVFPTNQAVRIRTGENGDYVL